MLRGKILFMKAEKREIQLENHPPTPFLLTQR